MTPLKVPLPDAPIASLVIDRAGEVMIEVDEVSAFIKVSVDGEPRLLVAKFDTLATKGRMITSRVPETADTSAVVPASPAGKSDAGEVSTTEQTGARSATNP